LRRLMDLYEAIKSRYSVRSYLNKPVEQEKLDRILDAARLAPSGSNRQPWKFVVVRDTETRKKLVHACSNQEFVSQAPVVIAGVGLIPSHTITDPAISMTVCAASASNAMLPNRRLTVTFATERTTRISVDLLETAIPL